MSIRGNLLPIAMTVTVFCFSALIIYFDFFRETNFERNFEENKDYYASIAKEFRAERDTWRICYKDKYSKTENEQEINPDFLMKILDFLKEEGVSCIEEDAGQATLFHIKDSRRVYLYFSETDSLNYYYETYTTEYYKIDEHWMNYW